jgi:ribosomal protein S18 acetylase RimI-like enzyme
MDGEPFRSFGLSPIRLTDKPAFDAFFRQCSTRLSDFSFANTFPWWPALTLRWGVLRDCLCVFANGEGGLSLMFPPLGGGDFGCAVREAMDICRAYNRLVRYDGPAYVEYVPDDLLGRFPGEVSATPMSGDYVYPTRRMIDLEGGDLASKRHSRNRFARLYAARTEPFGPQHVQPCLDLLQRWHVQHETEGSVVSTVVQTKRIKESIATAEALRWHRELGLTGMVLYADDVLVGFTIGELLADDTCNILIEKTDRRYNGSAQYIFSEFCRQYWAQTAWCNVGDDWNVPTLAWTKQSYRPAYRLAKWTVTPQVPAFVACGIDLPAASTPTAKAEPAPADPLPPDRARLSDLDELYDLEQRCFEAPLALKRRQIRSLLRKPLVSTHVIRKEGHIAASAVVLRRRTPRGMIGRLYSLAVDAIWRRAGLGRALLENCLNVLHSEGVQAVVLEVAVENHSAIGLYESSGFRKTHRLTDYYGPGRDGWKMRRETNVLVPIRNVKEFECRG